MIARALVVAAPSSGSGKTTIATGLMAALRRRGTAVGSFKVGPDYIDPGYHALATCRPGRNLDPVLVGDSRIGPLSRHGAAGCEIVVVEGAMGLFDGRIADGAGSTAHVAAMLGAPVVLVVDCRGQSRSLAATLHGFRTYDSATPVAGVVLNRVGSSRHAEVLREACAAVEMPVLGVVPRQAALEVPSRHLGLVTAAEHGAAARDAIDAMATLVGETVDLDAVCGLARPLPLGPIWNPSDETDETVVDRYPEPVVIAVAGGQSFPFSYAEHREMLEAAGAEVHVVDPLCDERLPDGTSGLILPGGFPEERVAELSANVSLLGDVRRLAASGAPVNAECGGLLYLCSELDGTTLCGVIPASASRGPAVTVGYREAVAVTESPSFARGESVTGHEFHRWRTDPVAGARPVWTWPGSAGEGHVVGRTSASFLHTHPAGSPRSAARFVEAARAHARRAAPGTPSAARTSSGR